MENLFPSKNVRRTIKRIFWKLWEFLSNADCYVRCERKKAKRVVEMISTGGCERDRRKGEGWSAKGNSMKTAHFRYLKRLNKMNSNPLNSFTLVWTKCFWRNRKYSIHTLSYVFPLMAKRVKLKLKNHSHVNMWNGKKNTKKAFSERENE